MAKNRKFHISEDDFLEVQKMNQEERNILPSSKPEVKTEPEIVLDDIQIATPLSELKYDTFVRPQTENRTNVSSNTTVFEVQNTKNDFEHRSVQSLDESKSGDLIYKTKDYSKFYPYPDKKLRLPLLTGIEREKLYKSISTNGIMSPIICKPNPEIPNTFIILSGHNRADIAKELNYEIPYIVKENLSVYTEQLIVIDENFIGRQIGDILPSHTAYALKIKREAESHQGVYDNGKSWCDNGTSEQYKIKKTMINIYIKLNELIQEFLNMVDNDTLTIKAGYNLAFVSEPNQILLYDYIQHHHGLIKISESIAKKLKEKDSMNCKFTPEFLDMFFDIISSPKTEPSSAPKKVYGSIVREYFGWASDEDAESIIREALTMANRNTIEILHKKGE